MPDQHDTAGYPRQVVSGETASPQIYRIQEHCFAVRGPVPQGARVLGTLAGDGGAEITLIQGIPGIGPRQGLGPVYAMDDGPPAVPTGLVFVRFSPGTDAAGRRADLADAGYELVKVPGYAPHAAWVRDPGGSVAGSLAGLFRLRTLGEVQSVEPQMLTKRTSKGGGEAG